MNNNVLAQLFPCCIGTKKDTELLKYWAWPKRQGMGLNDFQYRYEIPPHPKSLSQLDTKEERESFDKTRQHQYLLLEGKLTFLEYKALIEAYHSGTLVGQCFLENLVGKSWLPYDPLISQVSRLRRSIGSKNNVRIKV